MKYFALQIILGIHYLLLYVIWDSLLTLYYVCCIITYSSVKQRVFPSLRIDLMLLVFEKSLSGVIFHNKTNSTGLWEYTVLHFTLLFPKPHPLCDILIPSLYVTMIQYRIHHCYYTFSALMYIFIRFSYVS